jgi:hypothetical protein
LNGIRQTGWSFTYRIEKHALWDPGSCKMHHESSDDNAWSHMAMKRLNKPQILFQVKNGYFVHVNRPLRVIGKNDFGNDAMIVKIK